VKRSIEGRGSRGQIPLSVLGCCCYATVSQDASRVRPAELPIGAGFGSLCDLKSATITQARPGPTFLRARFYELRLQPEDGWTDSSYELVFLGSLAAGRRAIPPRSSHGPRSPSELDASDRPADTPVRRRRRPTGLVTRPGQAVVGKAARSPSAAAPAGVNYPGSGSNGGASSNGPARKSQMLVTRIQIPAARNAMNPAGVNTRIPMTRPAQASQDGSPP
jgi:hypothetical protein